MSKQSSFSKHVLNKTTIITSQLLKACSELTVTPSNAAEAFAKLHALTEELITIQKKFCFLKYLETKKLERGRLLENLVNLHQTSLDHAVSPKQFENYGFGLTSKVSLETGSRVLHVPRKLMLDVSGSWELVDFIQQDPIASAMENVALSLRVLSELIKGQKSAWYDYIYTLPSSYTTFLYMTPNDLMLLKGSPALVMVVSNYQSICRQYAYFFNRFHALRISFPPTFCFEDYRWAVSTVMSRNNCIPTGPELQPRMCLVPIWDMINHKPGQVTTDFDPVTNELIFYSMESCLPGDQILMDYGKRTSTEFFLFSGFVPVHNPHNRVTVNLAISKSDALAEKRHRLLERIGLPNPLSVSISADPSTLRDLIAFSRVFVMSEEQLQYHLLDPDASSEAITNADINRTSENDLQAVDFLIKRIGLLIMMYGQIPDEVDAEFKQMTFFEQMCARLKRQETDLLHSSVNSLRAMTNPETSVISQLEILTVADNPPNPVSPPPVS